MSIKTKEMNNMVENLIALLIPLITSTSGTVLIAKIAISTIKHVSKKKNEEVEQLKKRNQLLEEENLALKNTLANIDMRIENNIKNQEIMMNEVGIVVNEQRKSNEQAAKIVDSGTIIRNELRTLLEAKKE